MLALGHYRRKLLRCKGAKWLELAARLQSSKTVKLNNGCEIPVIGLGTWKSKPGDVLEAVKCAISVGYRHLDCAHVYENEREVGQAIACKIADGTVCREDLFITSKLWNTYHGDWCRVKQGLERTLADLNLHYVDLYLIHWPFGFQQGDELWPKKDGKMALSEEHHFSCVWKQMEQLQKMCLTRMIGVSNFNADQIRKLLNSSDICPVTNQVECHPYLNQVKLSTYCRENQISLTAYSPLGAPDFVKAGTPGPLDDEVVQRIACNHGKTPGQVLIRYQIQRGHVVIPKSVTPERIKMNFEVFDFELCGQEMNMLLGLERGSKLLRCKGAKWWELAARLQSSKTVKLNNGCEIPVIGLGTRTSKPGDVLEAVKCAISVGYRHLDCAPVYENEKEVGQAIACKIADGTVCREDLFITSKLWNTYHGDWSRVKQGLERTLADLNLHYVDLYLIHWPFGFQQGDDLWPKKDGKVVLSEEHHFCCVWKQMEQLQKMGLTRMIGISNFNTDQIRKLLNISDICPVTNQVECHPYLNQVKLSAYCRENNILLTAFGPLGAADFVVAGTPGPLDDEVIQCIAHNHGKTPGQILIRYQIQRGHAAIPKSVNPERIKQNLEVFDFELCGHEMQMLLGLERGSKVGRIYKAEEAQCHSEYPFPELKLL